ncbi:MAG TPA: 3-isopropylmalate dehydrogenase [Rhizomicrobium sp.]|jgi:3-isopropylmalate dehydrogenase
MTDFQIVLLPGDGIGPEVASAAQGVLEQVGRHFAHRFHFTSKLIGGAALDARGEPLPGDTLEACRSCDAILFGAVGGPKWDGDAKTPVDGLLALRKALGLFANLRPVAVSEATLARSPLRAEIVRNVDLLIVRELTGGAYFGEKKRNATVASDLCIYMVAEIERVARVAFDAAKKRRGHVTSVDKANVMETSRLWRETVDRVHQAEFRDVELAHMLVDTAAMRLIQTPRSFDVILTENMFGDILSDEASMLPGSIGLLGSASLGAERPGLYEPIHGSAPDIAGRDLANPAGTISSASMLLRYSLGLSAEADAVDAALATTLVRGRATADLGGTDTCSAFARAVADNIGV